MSKYHFLLESGSTAILSGVRRADLAKGRILALYACFSDEERKKILEVKAGRRIIRLNTPDARRRDEGYRCKTMFGDVRMINERSFSLGGLLHLIPENNVEKLQEG